MLWFKRIAVAALALGASSVVVCVGGGYLLPNQMELSTLGHIGAHRAEVLPYLTTVDGLDRWWREAARHAPPGTPSPSVVRLTGADNSPGLTVAFDTEGARMETWTLLDVGLEQVLWQVDVGPFTALRRFELVEDTATQALGGGEGTLVRWNESATVESPVLRWLTVLMSDEQATGNFDLALTALDAVASPDH